eukprot:Sspe_Gene.26038::Locus_10629_Transcript_1_1_Confidence_1.000_Length_568::g.26038::m.26038/K00432/gpx; glutathione peroxidase
METPASFYDITENDIDGSPVSFSRFRGKVVYGVNVASRCASTAHEYALMRDIVDRFRGQDVSVMAFPCNQFARQECGKDEEIAEFARKHGPVDLVVMSKGDIKGPRMRPTYRFITSTCPDIDLTWNFRAKFLVSRSGVPSATRDPMTDIGKLVTEPIPF